MISYATNKNGDHCLRLGGEATQTSAGAGIQICFGTFAHKHPCSVALNGKTTVYTGVMKATSNATSSNEEETPPVFSGFPKEFSEAPLTMASPNAGAYWFNDVLANTSTLSRVDFCMNEKHTKANPVNVSGNYIAIGKYGSTDIAEISKALAANDIHAYWNEASNAVRILGATTKEDGQQTVQAVQIVFGSLSVSGKFKQFNTSLYRLNASINKAFSEAFSSTPAVFAAPSMKCRDWEDSSKFSHPYWFGGISATSSKISTLSVYTNADYAKTVYGRYIAIGLSDNAVTGWDEVPISLTQGANGGYALRFGNDAGGMQLAFGDINFKDRKIQKPLNDVASNIYTAFKEAPAYDAATDMYFSKAFCESPSTVIMTSKACRTNDSNGDVEFLNPYWFGDAASDAVSIFNTDLYTNAQFKTDQDVYAKYLAAGKYTADSDTAAPLIREALAHLDNEPITGLTWYDGTALGSLPISKGILAEYTINRHNENPKSKDQIEFDQLKPAYTAISGWCSEFASVMADHVLGSNSTNSPFPRRASFRAFKKALSGAYYSTPSDELDDAKSSNDVPITPKVGDLLFTRGQSKNSETGKYNGHTCMVINANGSYVFTIEGNRKNPSGASGTVNNIVKRERRKIKGTNPDSGKDTIWGIGSIEWE